MIINMNVNLARMLVFAFAILFSVASNACGGCCHHRGCCYNGGCEGAWGGTGVIVNVPYGGYFPGYYYSGSCQVFRECGFGRCWNTRVCY